MWAIRKVPLLQDKTKKKKSAFQMVDVAKYLLFVAYPPNEWMWHKAEF